MPQPLVRERHGGRPPPRRSWLVRIAWFVAIWLASIAALGVVAWVIRFWLIG